MIFLSPVLLRGGRVFPDMVGLCPSAVESVLRGASLVLVPHPDVAGVGVGA